MTMSLKCEVALDIRAKDEVFTHKDDDGTFRTFLTGVMARFATQYGHGCEEIKPVRLPMQDHHIAHIKTNMGIEQDRIDRLVEPYLLAPVIAIEWPENDKGEKPITIVDGNHRMVKLHSMGEKEALCYIFTHPFWENFLLPVSRGEEALTTPSGVIEHERGIANG